MLRQPPGHRQPGRWECVALEVRLRGRRVWGPVRSGRGQAAGPCQEPQV